MDNLIVHHYGLATNNLHESMKVLSSLGYALGDVIIDPIQKVKLVFAKRPGEPFIEIICDFDSEGPTSKIVSKTGNGFYHICYEVPDINVSIEEFRNKGFLLRHKPVGAIAFKGKKIAWLYNRSMGLVELLEK